MTAAADSQTNWQQHFAGQDVRAQAVETGRDEWRNYLDKSWGGAGKVAYEVAGWVQKAAGAVIVGSSPALAIPVVGEVLGGAELAVYFATSAIQGAARTSAENLAITKNGGTKEDHGGIGRTLVNTLKALNPFD